MITSNIVRQSIVATSLVSALAACQNTDDTSGDAASASFDQWSLGAPTARIGGAASEGGVQLTEIKQVVPVGRDSILVVDSKHQALLLFDGEGKLVRQIGARGQGPGEFVSVAFAGRLADSVWGVDSNARQQTFFRLDGTYLSSRPLPSASVRTGPRTIARHTPHGVLSNGRMPGYIPVPDAPAEWGEAPPHGSVGMLALFERDSLVVDTLARIAQSQPTLYLNAPPYIHFPGPNHFIRTPLWHTATDGSALVLVDRAMPSDSTSAKYTVRKWDGNAEPSFSVDVPYVPKRVPTAQLDSVIDVLTDDLADLYPSRAAARKLVADTVGTSLFFPPVTDVVVSSGGSIWLAREGFVTPPLDTRRYDVLDARGTPVGTLTLQRPGKIVAATEAAVWVLELDAEDVPSLVRYPVVRVGQ